MIGAGPAGLAALELARGGARVTVYEQHRTPGGHLPGDFQALENWTTDADVLTWLEGLGVAVDFRCRPTHRITLADADLARYAVASGRPLCYVVKRGPDEDSLDRHLAAQAAAHGVAFRFGRRVCADELAGPVIVATGPGSTEGIVAGIVAETSHPDQVAAITSDAVVPKGYVDCVVWSGRATLATVVMRDFARARAYLVEARRAFARLGLSDFRGARRFGGRAHVGVGDPLVQGSRLYVARRLVSRPLAKLALR